MAGRDEMLAAIRRYQPAASQLPALDRQWIKYPDRLAQFASVVSAIGGQFIRAADATEANRQLREISACRDAKQIVSIVPGIGESNVDLAAIVDPHDLETVDFAVLPGEFGVAENGAIWVTDRGLKHRVVYFIAQHLALVIAADQVLDNMHEAYERLRFERTEFGAFIAGPSKTADIEQSLVIGAHGPRSLTVICVG
jgi:L-lactate dehydrogenase complex protein LldG